MSTHNWNHGGNFHQSKKTGGDELGPDHPHRGQPGHLHQDRFRKPPGRGVPQHLVDLPRLQHLHEGQGPARRPLHHQPHLRHLRRQPRDLRHLRPEHGLRRQAAGTSASGSSTSARPPSTCSTTTSSRTTWSAWISASRWSRRPTPACLAKAEATRAPHADAHGYRTIADIMRALNPFSGRVLSRSAADEPLTREMFCLMEGPPRASLHALPRRRRHGADRPALHRLPGPADEVRGVHEESACRCTTTCSTSSTRRCPATKKSASGASCSAAGDRSTIPSVCDYTYKNMTDWGNAMFVTPGVVVDGKLVTTNLVDINLNIRILLGSSYYDDWEERRDVRQDRPAGQSGRSSGIPGTRPPSRGRRSATSRASTPG